MSFLCRWSAFSCGTVKCAGIKLIARPTEWDESFLPSDPQVFIESVVQRMWQHLTQKTGRDEPTHEDWAELLEEFASAYADKHEPNLALIFERQARTRRGYAAIERRLREEADVEASVAAIRETIK